MQQRRLRLGDILDDYCPRERRITDHAIVAMIDDQIRQTRCGICDAEHEYKNARVPAQRKKKTGSGALYEEVLTGMPRKAGAAPAQSDSSRPEPDDEPEVRAALVAPAVLVAAPVAAAPPSEPVVAPVLAPPSPPAEIDGPVHRQLIRATLPAEPDGSLSTVPRSTPPRTAIAAKLSPTGS